MKTKRIFFILLTLLLATLALSACTGGRRIVASGWAGVTTDEETAYLAYNTHVYAIDLATGNERWRYPDEADPAITFYAPPALTDDGQLIVGGYDNTLYSLNPDNGQLNWTFEGAEGRYIGGPLVTEEGIFAGTTDHKVYAVNFEGQPIWDQPFPTEKEIWARPAADPEADRIYVASMDHHLYAVNPANGSKVWKTKGLDGSIVGTPALSEDQILYTGTIAKEVIALDAQNGGEIWRFGTEDWVWAGPAIQENRLYCGDLSGTFYAIDRESAELLWKVQPGEAIVSTPLVTEEAIYFTSEDGALVSVSPDGTIQWQQDFEGHTYTGPIAAEAHELILVSTDQPDALLVAMNSNGTQKWTFGEQEE